MKFSRRSASGTAPACTRPADDRREALVQRCRISYLFERNIGFDRIGRKNEYHRVGAANQRRNALPPILECENLLSINGTSKPRAFSAASS
jgi:hypothetical protein